MQADRDFASATAERGMEGWMEAYTADAVRLSMGGPVARGRQAIREFDAAIFEDPDVRLMWTPTDGGSFNDGRYGFTTGTSFMNRVSAPADTLWRGIYVTIWRREADGWKVVLDTGAGQY
jgi:ketosteroid isomerase-like protein